MVVYFYGIIIVGGRTDVRLFVCSHIRLLYVLLRLEL